VKQGEIYQTQEKSTERGHKPGFYVVISRNFIAGNEDLSTVICAPVYHEILGLRSELVLGEEDGLPHESAVRCDFLTLIFKDKLTHLAGSLSTAKMKELNRALRYALELDK
jgi:mRNA interferase MazF